MKKAAKRILKMTIVLSHGKKDDFSLPYNYKFSVIWYYFNFLKSRGKKLGQCLGTWKTTLLMTVGTELLVGYSHTIQKNSRAVHSNTI